jgi:cyclic-di-GMP-binding protein
VFSTVLSVPAHRVSAWVAETNPKNAAAWLAALPLANSAESAREIYQALYTVNRLELRLPHRLELMAMYDQAVATVCQGLQPHLLLEVPPLGPKKRQLAEFLRRLHIEMAYGYKCCLRDLSRARLSLRRKSRSAICIERALYHLTEVLLRSYVVYLPHPSGAWREIHELYRLAESLGVADGPLDGERRDAGDSTTIDERYVRTLLLGLTNPYQLPHGAAQQVDAFLARWAAQARIVSQVEAGEMTGCFRVKADADAPPVPLGRNGKRVEENTRVLDARALLQTVHQFAARLEQGESIEQLGLGIECLDSTCVELLHRMIRSWGETAQRRYARRQQSSNVFICIGLNAAHFYANGQRPFVSYIESLGLSPAPRASPDTSDVAFVDLDNVQDDGVGKVASIAEPVVSVPESHRVNRWRLRDIGPQGMSLTRYGDATAPIRVGDLIGVQQPTDLGRWRVAVIRWVKTPELDSIDMGIEMLAGGVSSGLVRRLDSSDQTSHFLPALLLPANEITKHPPTLLLTRGTCQVGGVVELIDEEAEPRQVRILRLLERTGSFEQVVYGEIVAPRLQR